MMSEKIEGKKETSKAVKIYTRRKRRYRQKLNMSVSSVPSQGEQNKQTQKYLFTILICIFFALIEINLQSINIKRIEQMRERKKRVRATNENTFDAYELMTKHMYSPSHGNNHLYAKKCNYRWLKDKSG